MKIDAHQHFWHYSPATHDWITPAMAVLQQHYLPPDLEPALRQAGYEGCVAVQASQTEDETNFLLELATAYPFVKGVVGWVNLRASNVAERLDYYTHQHFFKGVRHVVQSEPDDQFLLRPDFLKGLALLAPLGLTYDLLIYPRHLPVAEKMVSQFPNQKFVLDHLAKPFIKDGILQPWANDLHKLARHPQVYCKLSGMVTEADWQNWQPADLHPYLDVALSAFGPDRLMIGSDWPVCRLAGEYTPVMQVVETYIAQLSPAEQANILGLNATQFYGLD